jgi:hypothetical protein
MTLRPVIDRDAAQERLRMIFPPAAFDPVLSNPLAAAAAAAMIYVGAVVPDEGDPIPDIMWTRPSTVITMSTDALTHPSDDERQAYSAAAARQIKDVVALLTDWGHDHHPWYATNSRETLRDETWPKWQSNAAARKRPGIPTSSSKPRWALTASFADLFDPALTGDELESAIDQWQQTHLSTGNKIKVQFASDLANAEHEVPVNLPGYGVRTLEPGVASLILKGVIEQWAALRLGSPMVLAISQPGDKIYVMDKAKMANVGITINMSQVLPDAIIVDVATDPVTFWIIEAVATDGEINEARKAKLLEWAGDQYIAADHLQFLSAFAARNADPARRRLKDIASGTYCWFLDEPDHELSWHEIGE